MLHLIYSINGEDEIIFAWLYFGNGYIDAK